MTEPQPVPATEVAPDPTLASPQVEVTAPDPQVSEGGELKHVETPDDKDEVDQDTEVLTCLERETFDGKGGDDVPESDFVSHATEGVNQEGDA